MWIFIVALSFCLGILMGYRLPAWLAARRAYRRRKTFRLKVLRPYTPAAVRQTGQQGNPPS